MINFPTCKINLGLQILQKRLDGYHDLETVMLEVPFCDALEILPNTDSSKDEDIHEDLFITRGLPIPGNGNLCLDALNLLRKDFDIPTTEIHLLKTIPMGGGLGGGSSDAAYMLKLVNDFYSLQISDTRLEQYAAVLGSDCAFFIKGGIQLCEGRGEILSKVNLNLPKMTIVLVNFGIHVSTQLAFSKVQPSKNRTSLSELIHLPITDWKDVLVNDFEHSVFSEYPILKQAKEELYKSGAFYAAMSGSGSTLFGLFHEKPAEINFSVQPHFLKQIEFKGL